MPKPRALGYVAAAIVGEATKRLSWNQQAVIDLVQLNYHGDKDGVAALAKTIAENDALAWKALSLLEMGKLHEAEDLLLGAGPQK